jgi:hypothetical protein
VQSGWQPPPQYPHQPYYGHGPVPSWARPPIDKRLLRPRAWWYAVAAIPPLLGVGLAALFIVLAVRAFPGEPRPFTAPHTLIVRLDGGEDQTIWSQTRGTSVPSVDAPPSCVVRNRDSERSVAVSRAGNTTLTLNGNRYETQLNFTPPTDGTYSVACRPALGAGPQALALGERPHLARFGAYIVGAIAAFGLGVLLCGGAVALVAVLRHRHKRRLQEEAMGRPA